jgi:hypothetical protein
LQQAALLAIYTPPVPLMSARFGVSSALLLVTIHRPLADNDSVMLEDLATELAARLDRIKSLTEQLVRVQDSSATAKELAARIQREVDATREAMRIHKTLPG